MKKYVVLVLTGILGMLGAESNLMENPSGQDAVPASVYREKYPRTRNMSMTDRIPTHWGVFPSGIVRWGISPRFDTPEKNNVFLKLSPEAKPSTAPRWLYLFIGDSDGYDGSRAFEVKPGQEYTWSVSVRGDAGPVEVRMLTWPKDAALNSKSRKVSCIHGSLHLLPQWQTMAGTFRIPADVGRVAIGLRTPEIQPGQSIYAHDAFFGEKPSAALRRKGGEKPNVAIYDPGDFKTSGKEEIRKLLEASGLECGVIDTLDRKALEPYDVLILTTTRQVSRRDRGDRDLKLQPVDWVGSLMNFVDGGGGLILGHDCVGQRGVWEVPLFPQVCAGGGLSKARTLRTFAADHAIVRGVAPEFEQSYSDHVRITPGKNAKVLLTNADGSPAAVAGTLSRGKIVAFGFPIGLNRRDVPQMPNVHESKLLVNAVRWAGSSDQYSVPPILTDGSMRMDYNSRLSRKASGRQENEKKELIEIAKLPAPRFDQKIIWNFSYGLNSEKQIEQIVQNSKRLGFNEFLVQANDGHSLFYRSDRYPGCTFRRQEDFCDVVAAARKYTRKYQMKLGVFVMPFTWTGRTHCNLKPEITPRERELLDGKRVTMTQLLAGSPRWMCPNDPVNQQRVLDITEEIIRKFQPDEIHFDYVRYSGGYESPCCCDGCLVRKGKLTDSAFARRELMDFYTRLNALCKKVSPNLVTSCYTMSNGPEWVFGYPFDVHYRYVSRDLSESAGNVRKLMEKYHAVAKKWNPQGRFAPIVANYEYKSGARMYAELQLLSQVFDELNVDRRTVMYYCYNYVARDKALKTGELLEDTAGGLRRALTSGTARHDK